MIKNVHKTILAFATLVLCLCAFTAQAQFSGEGYYRIQNALDPTLYIAYENTTGNDLELSTVQNDQSVIYIKLVPGSTTEYNLLRRNSSNYINIPSSTVKSNNYDVNALTNIESTFTIAPVGTSDKYTIGYIREYTDINGDPATEQKYINLKIDNGNKLATTESSSVPMDNSRGPEWNFIKLEATFTTGGVGSYRIESVESPGTYMTFNSTNNSDITTSSVENNYSSIDIQLAPATPSGVTGLAPQDSNALYNLLRYDGTRFLYLNNGITAQSKNEASSVSRYRSDNDSTFDVIYEAPYYRIVCTNSLSATQYVGVKFDGSDIATSGVIDIGGKWLLTPLATASVDEINTQKALKAYPNPSSDGIFTLDEASEWSVYSITGALISNGNGTKIDISSAPKGMYILRSNGIATKLVIQ